MTARPQMMTAFTGTRRELIAKTMRVAHQDSTPLARAATMARSAAGGITFHDDALRNCGLIQLDDRETGLSP